MGYNALTLALICDKDLWIVRRERICNQKQNDGFNKRIAEGKKPWKQIKTYAAKQLMRYEACRMVETVYCSCEHMPFGLHFAPILS